MARGNSPGTLPGVGTVVDLSVHGVSRTWRTRVEQVDGSALLVVSPTRGDGSPYVVDRGTAAAVAWNTDTARLQASGTITGGDVDVVPRWWLTVAEVARMQRRSAFRLRIARPVRLAMDAGQLSGVTDDLSETGALVVVPAPASAEVGQPVRVRIALTDEEELLLDATVVRTGSMADGRHSLGLLFAAMDDALEDRVRRFVLEEQFRLRGGGEGG